MSMQSDADWGDRERVERLARGGDEGALWAWQRYLLRAAADLGDWLRVARQMLAPQVWIQTADALLDRGLVRRDREIFSANPDKLPKLKVTILGDTAERSNALLRALLVLAEQSGATEEGSGYFRIKTARRRYRVQLRPNAVRALGSGGVLIGVSGEDLGENTGPFLADTRTAYHLKTPFVCHILDRQLSDVELKSLQKKHSDTVFLSGDLGESPGEVGRALLDALDGWETGAPALRLCSPKLWITDVHRGRRAEGGLTRVIGHSARRHFVAGDAVKIWDFGAADGLTGTIDHIEVVGKYLCSSYFQEIDSMRLRPGLRMMLANDPMTLSTKLDALFTFDPAQGLRQDPLWGLTGVVSGEWQVRVQRRIVPGSVRWVVLEEVAEQSAWGRLELEVGVPLVAGDEVELWRGGVRRGLGVVTGV
jgi:hypothetical protein